MLGRIRFLVVFHVMVALSCRTATADEPENSELARGVKLLRNMEDAKAIEALEKALNWPDNTPRIRGQIYLHMGIAQSNLLKRERAIESFRRAVVEDPDVRLPERTSPKIRALFNRARAEIEKERTPPPSTSAPVKRPEKEKEKEKRPPAPTRPSLLKRTRSAWVALGATVAVAGGGLALGALSRNNEDKAADTSLTYDDAEAHHDRARNQALGANIMFGLAGAGAVITGVLFYLGSRSGERPRTTASLTPGRGGMMAQIRTAW